MATRDPDIRIRPPRPGDASALSRLYRRSVAGLGPRDYSPAQVAAWLRLARLARDGRRTLVAEKAGTMLGFADIEPNGYLNYFYCAPEAVGTGVASALYAELEAIAIALAQGLLRLYAEVSETAYQFFMRQGFSLVRRRELEIGGIAIPQLRRAEVSSLTFSR